MAGLKAAAVAMRVMFCCWLVIMILSKAPLVVHAHDEETFEEVTTTDGSIVVYGASNTYTIWSRESGIGYYPFHFGLGFEGLAVRTDTAITMGLGADASRIYACVNGTLSLVATDPEGTPANALIRVRLNSTDNYYRLQITETSPPVYVQFVLLSQGGLLCTSGLPGTPIQFSTVSSTTSTFTPHVPATDPGLLYELGVDNTHVLRQVVDASA